MGLLVCSLNPSHYSGARRFTKDYLCHHSFGSRSDKIFPVLFVIIRYHDSFISLKFFRTVFCIYFTYRAIPTVKVCPYLYFCLVAFIRYVSFSVCRSFLLNVFLRNSNFKWGIVQRTLHPFQLCSYVASFHILFYTTLCYHYTALRFVRQWRLATRQFSANACLERTCSYASVKSSLSVNFAVPRFPFLVAF
jgi:hypothetical protein